METGAVLALTLPYTTVVLNQMNLPVTPCHPGTKLHRIMTAHYPSIVIDMCLLKMKVIYVLGVHFVNFWTKFIFLDKEDDIFPG